MSDFHEDAGSTRYAGYLLASNSLAAIQREEAATSVRGLGVSSTAVTIAALLERLRLEAALASTPRTNAPSLPDEVARARRALRDDPLDDLEPHAADAMLRELVARHGADTVAGAIVAELGTGDLETQGALVQSLGRVDAASMMPSGVDVLRAALGHASPRVRGAALKAIEAWNTPAALEALRGHDEPVAYLAETVKRLLARR